MKKKIRSFFLIIFCLVIAGLILGCGGGGGGGGDSTPATSTSAYPDVAGTYSINVTATTVTCTDGSKGQVDAIARTYVVYQNLNQIEMAGTASSSTPLPPTITVVSITNANGNVDPAGNFIANQNAVVRISGVPGDVTYIFNYTGAFTATGWSGNLKYTMMMSAVAATCTGTAPFTGERISKSTAQTTKSAQAEEDRTLTEVHSIFDAAGMLLGLGADGSDNP